MKLLQFIFLLLILLGANIVPTYGHAPNQSYAFLTLSDNGISGRISMTTTDINRALGTNLQDGQTETQVEPILPQLKNYIKERIQFQLGDIQYEILFEGIEIFVVQSLGDYVELPFKLSGLDYLPESIDVNSTILFDQDPSHRFFIITEYFWKAGVFNEEANISLIFSSNNTSQTLKIAESSAFTGFVGMIREGIWHIWIGIDHILFLLALLLPAVVVRRKESLSAFGFTHVFNPPNDLWAPVDSFKVAFIYVLKIITFFTIAHSITLSLAALNIFNLNSSFVESMIAFSIGLAAYHNLRPLFKKKDYLIAFGFGLFHGFGFASVLGDLGLKGEFLVLSLLGFNIGVEIGQLAIIVVLFPILFLLRNSKAYPKILTWTSVLLIAIALYWFIERAFGINFILDDMITKVIRKIL